MTAHCRGKNDGFGLYAWLRIQQNLIGVFVFMAIEIFVFPILSSDLLRYKNNCLFQTTHLRFVR
jgi:hypothetical protein